MSEKTIEQKIEENALGQARVTVDGTDVTAVDIEKQIKAAEFLAAQNAKEKNHCGLTFRQLTPGGCG